MEIKDIRRNIIWNREEIVTVVRTWSEDVKGKIVKNDNDMDSAWEKEKEDPEN